MNIALWVYTAKIIPRIKINLSINLNKHEKQNKYVFVFMVWYGSGYNIPLFHCPFGTYGNINALYEQ